MNLDVLKATVHFSKWGDSKGSSSLILDVVPQDRAYIEIGDEYLFSASSYAHLLGKERQLVGASVSVTANPGALATAPALAGEKEQRVCGWASFYPERKGSLDQDPAQMYFRVVVEPEALAEMVRTIERTPGAATLSLSLDGLEYGWEPDGSHLIWKVGEPSEKRAITNFSYSVERFWTSEHSIKEAAERKLNAELADSPNPKHRELAAIDEKERALKRPDPTVELLKQCRSLLMLLIALALVALFLLNR